MSRAVVLPRADRVAVDRVSHEEVVGIIHGDRPEAFGRRCLAFREPQHIFVGAVISSPFGILERSRVDGVLRAVRPQPDGRDERPLEVVDPSAGEKACVVESGG